MSWTTTTTDRFLHIGDDIWVRQSAVVAVEADPETNGCFVHVDGSDETFRSPSLLADVLSAITGAKP